MCCIALLRTTFWLTICTLTLAGPLALTTPEARASEEVWFPTSGGPMPPQQIRGLFTKPDGGGPFPAVVLLHGCSGLGNGFPTWTAFFREKGFAALVVDSFGPRGVTEICSDFHQVTTAMRIADAYGALEYLAARPDVRPDRILAVGFSHGGGVALDVVSSVGAAKRPQAPGNAPWFRAAAAFYPNCGEENRKKARYEAPLLLLIGEDDDLFPPRLCQELADFRHEGPSVTIKVYPGALHGFAAVELPRTYRPAMVNKYSPTGRGVTVGGDAAAAADARLQLETFLRRFEFIP